MIDLQLGILLEFSSRNRGLSALLAHGFNPDHHDIGVWGMHIHHLSTRDSGELARLAKDRRARGRCQRCSRPSGGLARCASCTAARRRGPRVLNQDPANQARRARHATKRAQQARSEHT